MGSIIVNANSHVYSDLSSSNFYSFRVAAVYPSQQFTSGIVSVGTGIYQLFVVLCILIVISFGTILQLFKCIPPYLT